MDRAVAVVLREPDRVLVVKRVRDGRSYAVLPGGGIGPDETPAAAALRELHEETGADGTIVRSLWVLQHEGRTAHYFLVDAPDVPLRLGLPEADRSAPGNRYEPAWLPVDRLAAAGLQPEAIRTPLTALISAPRVRRVGDAAVRPLQRWSAAVHAALRFLRTAGSSRRRLRWGSTTTSG